ncbi:MAG TPA: response regulator [Candidatus Pristimantibacillus sp.]|jgi:two-component system alkaline phosphatase synthesis response regulator PhoP|nr:response regulator [Candidatus Pristimantibacillus sp.]
MKSNTNPKSSKKSTVLIVEDEQSLNEAYQMILRKAGYTVQVAFDGQEALEVSEMEEPALILLDLRMPRMDGIEFLRNYNLRKDHPEVKVIVFSNYDMQREIDEAYNLGADRYFMKALASPKELLQVVENTLSAQSPN